jgi:hypothetical protein
MHTRIEVNAGLAHFDEYLAAWAAFDRWVEERRDTR